MGLMIARFKEKAENWKEESKRGPGTAVDDDKLSARALVHQSTRIISEPREYQLQLFEIAKQMNCLAVLDTGMPSSISCWVCELTLL